MAPFKAYFQHFPIGPNCSHNLDARTVEENDDDDDDNDNDDFDHMLNDV